MIVLIARRVFRRLLAETVANIAAFLAQTSWESAKYTACDENNHTGKSNASCTQRGDGALYQNVNTGPYACALDSSMTVKAVTHASWTVGPLECKPDPTPTPTDEGWASVENCCWWGRGSIQTTGPTNYGALQHDVLDKREGNTLDLCKDPELLCSKDDLKWTAGVYYWVKQVQQASCFVDSLVAYVKDYNMTATPSGTNSACHPFAEGVGGVVNNGAWNAHAHGDHVDANNKEVTSNGVDGRVPRFEKFMTTFKTKIQAYQADTDHSDDVKAPKCTGDAAVDFILDAADVESLAEINASASVYKWSGLCKAL